MTNKYSNRLCRCILKHQHDSIWEAEVCNYLYSMARQKKIKGYMTQKAISLDIRGNHICDHIVDFYIVTNDHRKVFVEAKGFNNPVWAIKRKLTQALYPRIAYLTVYRGELNKIDEVAGS